MDAEHFDAVTRILIAASSRRHVLRLLSGLGLVGLVVPADTEAKRKHTHKKPKKVTLCVNGQTLSVAKSAVPALLALGATLGACPPASPPSPPPPPTPPLCYGQPDGTTCGSGQQCNGGVCATPPTCETLSCTDHNQCCSGVCIGSFICEESQPGEQCFADVDCTTHNCVGFVCQPS